MTSVNVNAPSQGLGEVLKIIRQARGRSLREVAEGSGISISHLSQIERAVKAASPDVWRRLASALGLRDDFFLHIQERARPEHRDENLRRLEQTVLRVRRSMSEFRAELAKHPDPEPAAR